MFSIALIEAIAERDCHIREMLELKKLADKHNVPSRCNEILQGWVDEWSKKNPHQFKLFQERLSVERRIEESQS